MDGITAAVVGALVGAVVVIATRSIVDIPSALLLLLMALLIYLKKLKEPYLIVIAAVAGVIA